MAVSARLFRVLLYNDIFFNLVVRNAFDFANTQPKQTKPTENDKDASGGTHARHLIVRNTFDFANKQPKQTKPRENDKDESGGMHARPIVILVVIVLLLSPILYIYRRFFSLIANIPGALELERRKTAASFPSVINGMYIYTHIYSFK